MKCPNCGVKMQKKENTELRIVLLNEKDIEFLKESNAIEREYTEIALDDAMESFRWAYANMDKIDMAFILQVHNILMRRLNPRIAGTIRNCSVYIGNEILMQSKKDIEISLEDWLKGCYHNEEDIRQLHIWFEKIHPFADGNGRTGRILMNIMRLKIGLPILIIHEGKEQREYYKWFKEGVVVDSVKEVKA